MSDDTTERPGAGERETSYRPSGEEERQIVLRALRASLSRLRDEQERRERGGRSEPGAGFPRGIPDEILGELDGILSSAIRDLEDRGEVIAGERTLSAVASSVNDLAGQLIEEHPGDPEQRPDVQACALAASGIERLRVSIAPVADRVLFELSGQQEQLLALAFTRIYIRGSIEQLERSLGGERAELFDELDDDELARMLPRAGMLGSMLARETPMRPLRDGDLHLMSIAGTALAEEIIFGMRDREPGSSEILIGGERVPASSALAVIEQLDEIVEAISDALEGKDHAR